MARKSPLPTTTDGSVGTTRASAVYEQLRADITHGILEPGRKLRVEAMCKRYAVGASPLREALSRLSAEGLVDRAEQRGFNVTALKWDELPILTHSRAQIESLALRESIHARDIEWEHDLVLLVHRLSRTPRSLREDVYIQNPEWEALHRDFHKVLLARCPSRWMRSFCDSLADEAYRFRQVAAGQSFSSRNEHTEHLAIFEASIAGKADDAVKLLVQHYMRTATLVASQAKEGGHSA